MQKLTGAMNRALFDHEAVFIGREDVVPDWRIAELFGADALAFAQRMIPNGFTGYGIGDYTELYGNIRGFQIAATYHNIRITHQEHRAASAT